MNDSDQSKGSAHRVSRGAKATDAAAWAATNATTATAREQLAELLSDRTKVTEIAARFANVGEAQREGHMFEFMHELSFNLNAIAHDDPTRLRVTTWLKDPHAPDDLRLFDGSGTPIGGVQAKVVDSVSARLGPHNGLSDPKYSDLSLLVPSDDVPATQEKLTARLAMPEGPLHERYRSVQARLSDQASHGETQSDPVSRHDLAGASDDPQGYLRKIITQNEAKQIGVAGLTTGTIAAITGFATKVAVTRIKTGSFDGMDWAQIGRDSAVLGAKAAAIGLASQSISVLAQHALADGGGVVADALVGGTLPFALARGAFDLAAIGHGLATHRLTAKQAALDTAESISRTSAVWACAAIGQTLIPIPVVGAAIGGMVGQYGSAMLIQGMRLAITARDLAAEWDADYEVLLQQTEEVRIRTERELEQLHELSEKHDTAFAGLVLPRLDRLSKTMASGGTNEILDDLAGITRAFGGKPLFVTMEEFEAFMANDDLTLTLDLGGSNRTRYERPRTAMRT